MHHTEIDVLFPTPPLRSICQAAIFVPKLWQSEWHAGRSSGGPTVGTRPPDARLGDNKSSSAKRGEAYRGCSPPGVSGFPPEASSHPHTHTHPPTTAPTTAPPTPFVRQGQGTKCWVIHIKLSGWKRLQMLLFLCLVLSPRSLYSLTPVSCQHWLPGCLACEVLKSWKNVAREREVEALAPARGELEVFYFPLPSRPKVLSKQSEANGFIFSCARGFVDNRERILFVPSAISANIYYPSLSAMTGGFQNLMHYKYFPHFLQKVGDKGYHLNSFYIWTN